MKISSVKAIEVLDSRGKPTVRTFVTLEDGSVHSASVPSGASTGSHEAVELRDGDPKRYTGLGVEKAVNNVNNSIANAVKGLNVESPKKIDQKMIEMDGTENKSNLGANAILSVSMAVTRAAAYVLKKPLWKFLDEYYFFSTLRSPALPAGRLGEGGPRLMVNIINGGKHASWNFDIQEFMVIPTSTKPSESVRVASEIFHSLAKLLKEKKLSTLVGDEGGYSPSLQSNEEAFEVIIEAAKVLGYENNKEYNLGIDAAASEFYKEGKYFFKKTNQKLSGEELIKFYLSLKEKYHLISFEDPFAEDDWGSFQKFTDIILGVSKEGFPEARTKDIGNIKKKKTTSPIPVGTIDVKGINGALTGGNSKQDPQQILVVGDDLFVTNVKRIEKGIEEKSANTVLIKLNQIGTVSETADAINMTKKAGWKVVISHRSGETEDSFVADLAYGSGADFIKSGSMSRSERLAKYNRLLEIENNL